VSTVHHRLTIAQCAGKKLFQLSEFIYHKKEFSEKKIHEKNEFSEKKVHHKNE
jgi:hypothetical protein